MRGPSRIDRFGSYEVIRRLGTGGMAEVHLAIQRMASGVERPVVLKSILPHLADDAKFVRMFLREARIAAMLSHPNIVQIVDVQEIEGLPCIVMECLRGRDIWMVLRALTKNGERASAEEVAAVGAQAARGLVYAHQLSHPDGRPLGLVHRDVSPHNLFLTREGYVRLLDFGIAKINDDTRTQQSTLKGKISYMAPEQARGLPLDGRADQFALGVVLWELVTGRRLFYRGDPVQTLSALLDAPVPALAALGVSVPAALEAVIRRMLEREREARFASCGEVADALRAVLAGASRGEESWIAGLLARAVPAEEDEAYYGLDASGRRTHDVIAPPTDEDEEDTGDLVEPWTRASDVRASDLRASDVRAPSDDGDASDTPVLASRPRAASRRAAAAAIGVAVLAAAGGVVTFALGSSPSTSASSAEDPSVFESAASTEPAAPLSARLWLDELPAGALVEIDGAPHVGALPAPVERDRTHAVRVIHEGVEIWRWEGLVTGAELRLPVTPSTERSAPAAPPSEVPSDPPSAPGPRGRRDRARPSTEPQTPTPTPTTPAASPAVESPSPWRPRGRTRSRGLEIETEYP